MVAMESQRMCNPSKCFRRPQDCVALITNYHSSKLLNVLGNNNNNNNNNKT